MIANTNVNDGRSGLDTNTILGSIHTFECVSRVLLNIWEPHLIYIFLLVLTRVPIRPRSNQVRTELYWTTTQQSTLSEEGSTLSILVLLMAAQWTLDGTRKIFTSTVLHILTTIGLANTDLLTWGNPWYIGTFAAGQQLYQALYQWKAAGGINVTPTSLPFFKQLVSSVTPGNYASGTSTYTTLYNAVSTYADGE